MPPTTHAKLGASASHRWMNCPGSIQQSEGIEDNSSKYAREGTAAHELGERILHQRMKLQGGRAHDFIGVEIPVEYEEGGETLVEHWTVTEEMADAVQVYVDHVQSRIDELDALDEEGCEVFIEHRFNLAKLNPPGPMFGTSDCTIWHEGSRHLDVNDYKHGAGVAVDATENSQLMTYALGAVVEIGKRPDTIRVTITQPRGHHPEGIIRSYDFGWDELIAFKEELFEAARRTEEEDAPLVPGEWCRFCPAHATCPAKREQANLVAAGAFDVAPPAGALPDPGDIGDEQLQFIMANAGQVMDWLRAVEAHVMARLERGEEFPGYKLVEGRSNRRWKDEEAVDKYLRGRGLKKGERYVSKLVSPAQAEKLLKPLEGPDLPERFWEKPEGKLKLVPEADKRPAIQRVAQDVFGVVPQTQTNTENDAS